MSLVVTMNPDEIHFFQTFFESNFPTNGKFVEWGSGGSTLLFLGMMTGERRMISIEHNKEWFDKVSEAIKDHPNRDKLLYLYIPPSISLDFYGYGVASEENACYNLNYINPELALYKKNNITIFDANAFLVDGISRGACMATIFSLARNNQASVFLHDYVGREAWYNWAVSLFPIRSLVGKTLIELKRYK